MLAIVAKVTANATGVGCEELDRAAGFGEVWIRGMRLTVVAARPGDHIAIHCIGVYRACHNIRGKLCAGCRVVVKTNLTANQ